MVLEKSPFMLEGGTAMCRGSTSTRTFRMRFRPGRIRGSRLGRRIIIAIIVALCYLLGASMFGEFRSVSENREVEGGERCSRARPRLGLALAVEATLDH